MSQENVEIVRRIVEAAQRGDWDAAIAEYDEAVVWTRGEWRMPDGGIYYGHEGVRDFYTGWVGAWDDFHISLERLVDAGDRVVDINEVSGTGKGSGAPVSMRTGNVWTLDDGRVVRHVGYPDAAEALEAAGLRE
jgi:ketosteroid isomerase-like protein